MKPIIKNDKIITTCEVWKHVDLGYSVVRTMITKRLLHLTRKEVDNGTIIEFTTGFDNGNYKGKATINYKDRRIGDYVVFIADLELERCEG